jgi:hypothetical protein
LKFRLSRSRCAGVSESAKRKAVNRDKGNQPQV